MLISGTTMVPPPPNSTLKYSWQESPLFNNAYLTSDATILYVAPIYVQSDILTPPQPIHPSEQQTEGEAVNNAAMPYAIVPDKYLLQAHATSSIWRIRQKVDSPDHRIYAAFDPIPSSFRFGLHLLKVCRMIDNGQLQ